MTTEAIFAKAIELEPNQRAEFLLQACAGNDSRRRKVEQLLEAHFEEDSLLGGNALQTTSAEVSESIGESVGPYKLLQKLGEGGMGVVYLAERLKPVKQRVALKIIKSGMDSKKFIARFEAERQALAMMDHPNIAKVFDAGTTDAGRPYFVMELVKGVPITSFCEDNKVPARQRIELLLDVCHAVQHAHQKGIIHRDLKPSNVLVAMYDDKPVPKVIDFGLAKAANQTLTEKTLFTEVGSILGTWEYMSPEQAVLNQLDVDTRTDVYSLGVMLYELMTGVTPLDRRRLRQVQLRETLRIIQEEEPPRPSTRLTDTVSNTKSLATYRAASPQELTRFIRGDLDWITMKALEKDRKRRYESASRLAEDLGNFLSGDAVEARPPTWVYRASKLWRRHRWPIVTAGVILVGLLTSTGVISTLLIKSRKLATDREITNDELRRNKDELVQKQAQLFKEKQRVEKSRYASHMQNAMAAWYRNDLKLMSLLLDRYRGQANDRWEWRYLNGLLESTFNEVVSETTNPNCLEISPGDGSIAMSHPYYRHFSLQRPDGTTTEFHDGAATGKWTHNFVAFSKNGALVLHSNEGLRQVVIRESQTLEIKAKVGLGTLVPIRDAIFKPDASGVWFTAGADGFWSFSFGDELPRQFSTRNAFSGPLQIVSNQSKLIHGHDVISVFHLPSLEFERELVDEGMGRVYDICELTDQGLLASSHQDRFVRLWNIQNGKLERKLGPLGGEARVLSYDSSTKRLAVGCRNREVIVFDSQAFTVVERIRGFAGRFAMSYEKEGSLVYGAYGNALRATRGGTASNTRIHLGGWVAELLFDGRGRLIARSNVDQNEISIIDVESLTVRRVKLPGDRIRHLADSVIDEATIIAVDVNASQIIAYDLLTEELKHRIEFPEGSVVSAIALDANTRSLCLGFSDGRVAFVDLSKVRSKIQFCLDQHSNLISAATAIGNGTFATADSKSRVLLWKDGKVIDRKTSFGGKIEALASFNRTLAVGLHADVIPENNSFLFPEATKQECIRLPGHAFQVEDMKFIENGATLVSIGGDREIKILDLELREPRLMIQDDEIYTSMAISPGEEIIAAGTREGSVILYRAPNKETLPID